jgi:hypothetical protein
MEIQYIFILFIFVILICIFQLFGQTWTTTIENMEDMSFIKGPDAFCETYRGNSGALESACGKLTQQNCNSTSCCVYASPGKCVAGGVKGPTFNSDEKGKTLSLDYYYYQNKCYGTKCE